jgi:DMSO/TMAO reductase YedYZ heme-binding membrane subunit
MRGTGRALVAITAHGVGGLVALVLAQHGGGREGVGAVLRSTARVSGPLFLLAFSASSLRHLWRHRVTAWLLANRRALGVAAAAAHTWHMAGIAAYLAAGYQPVNAFTLVAGTLAYLCFVAMAATSSDRAVARLGARRWKRLHTLGGWYIWAIFTATFAGVATRQPASAVYAALCLAALALRLAARLRRRG